MFSKDVQLWFSIINASSPTLFNTYGPTEATVVSTVHKVLKNNSLSNKNPPIGQPIPGATVLLINRLGQMCPLGGVGELHIGGAGVATGYIGSKSKIKNLAKFVEINYNSKYLGRFYKTGDLGYYSSKGELRYLGRVDNQVKIRGFRIEPDEIDTILSNYPSITNCITLAIKFNLQINLVTFITIEQNELYNKEDILEYSKMYLPEYMLPNDIMLFEKLPKLINGKVDVSYLNSFYIENLEKDNETFLEKFSSKEKILIQLWRKILGKSPPNIEANFFECGGNSLNAIRFSILIQQNFNITFPTSCLYINSCIKDLSHYLHIAKSNNLTYPSAKEEIKFDSSKFVNWRQQESIIKLGICTSLKKIPLPQENIMLTGSTGFLGSHMLHSLLRNTNGKIFCLTRGKSETEVKERIKAALKKHKITNYCDIDRIIPLPGNVGHSKLGLSHCQYKAISKEVTRIVHCAADTNMLLPYEKFINANVDGTRNILEFAADNVAKKVEYISTMAIFGCNPSLKKVDINTKIDNIKHISSGYAQSKWVGDKLALSAISQGLDLRIYRCGRIWGNLKNYIGPDSDFIIRFLKGCLAIKAFPRIHMKLDVLPIDFITETIIKFANQSNSLDSRVLHLCNIHSLSIEDIIRMLQIQGQVFQVIDYLEWRDNLISYLKKEEFITNPLYPLISVFEPLNPNNWVDDWLPCKKTERILANMNISFPDVKELLASNIELIYEKP